MLYRLRIFTVVLSVLSVCCFTNGFIVLTQKGPVHGKTLHVGHHRVYAFKNIPYATQPVGNFRFELPEDPKEWISADDLPKTKIACPCSLSDSEEILPYSISVQEDCLFLDVYVRKEYMLSNSSAPVLVYFHGGGFNSGSKEEYGPDFLLRFNDIILVIPNYRLGILGFLSGEGTAIPSNVGLWDQLAVLKWVSLNIQQFGGDPESITIAGHEAGGVSVGLHVLARASHGYFHRAISISGSAFSPSFLQKEQPSTVVGKVAELLQCKTDIKDELLSCLKEAPLQQIREAQANIKEVDFLPSMDGTSKYSLMPSLPETLYHEGRQKNIPYLVGYAEGEASYEVSREFPKVLIHQHLDKMIRHFLNPYFKGVPNFESIVKAAKYHYLRGIVIPSFESIEPHIAKMMTDFLYKSPAEQIMKLHGRKMDSVFMYVSKHGSVNICGPNKSKKCFGDETYIFNKSIGRKKSKSGTRKVAETLSKVWGHFIIYGNLDYNETWKPYGENDNANFAEVSDTIQPKSYHNSDDTEFWSSLVSDLIAARNHTEHSSHFATASEYTSVGTWGAAGLAILFIVLCIALIGSVVITKRRTLMMSILPVSSSKDINFSNG